MRRSNFLLPAVYRCWAVAAWSVLLARCASRIGAPIPQPPTVVLPTAFHALEGYGTLLPRVFTKELENPMRRKVIVVSNRQL